MEATAALGLAGNIVQFLDFGQKLCRTVSEIYRSGSGITRYNADTENLTNAFASNLDAVSESLTRYCVYLGNDAAMEAGKAGRGDIQPIIDGCKSLALSLVNRLGQLKVGKQTGRWKSLVAAVKAMWEEKELSDMEDQLRRFRTELQWAIVVSLRRSMDLLESRQEDQFQRLQLSMSSILSKLIQANIKALPEWSIGLPSNRDLYTAPRPAAVLPVTASPGHDIDAPYPDDLDSTVNAEQQRQDLEARLAMDYAGEFARAEKAVLDSLAFSVMRDRETAVASAEAATFNWIFHDPRRTDRPWSNFHVWLASDTLDRLYWINGKAGSGKSTLMKHLVNHQKTKEALGVWAGETRLLLTHFFFWYSGQELQKSQVGMLRALLYACLKNHRELIPVVAPSTANLNREELVSYWTLPRLQQALNLLVSQTVFDIKFAFFIDGLDEYAGSYDEIIDILKNAVSCGNVKICVSSRPLIAFERAFESSPHLVLQNLTYDDISLYVDSKLSHDRRMRNLELEEPGLRADLTSSIVCKASGVFLWVHLVVGSLLDGLGNYDVGADLKRRLDDLPAELEALYWHMVDRVKPGWYLEEGFRLLRMVKASPTPVTLLRLCFAEMPESVVHSRGFLTEPSRERQAALCRNMAGRLKSRCLGLLEAPSYDEVDPTARIVSFIHKSVFDFLGTDTAQSRIMACPGQDTFVPEVALMRARILELKTLPSRISGRLTRADWFRWLRREVCDCIKLARAAEQATGSSQLQLMRELRRAVDGLWTSISPRTAEEECGRVHWISAHVMSTMAVMASQLPDEKPFVRVFLDQPPQQQPGNIKNFDELCQKAGLNLYAVAVGLQEWPVGVLGDPPGQQVHGLNIDHRRIRDRPLAAAEEISAGRPRAPAATSVRSTGLTSSRPAVLPPPWRIRGSLPDSSDVSDTPPREPEDFRSAKSSHKPRNPMVAEQTDVKPSNPSQRPQEPPGLQHQVPERELATSSASNSPIVAPPVVPSSATAGGLRKRVSKFIDRLARRMKRDG